jgi:nitroreductase
MNEMSAEHAQLLTAHAHYLIATAGRAASVHNSQPWRFRLAGDSVELWSDPGRKVGADAVGREMLISCGAALYGLRLGIRSLGYQPVVSLLPDHDQLRFLARVTVGKPTPMNALEHRLLAAVPHRHTHRGPFEPGPLPAGLLAGLQDDALMEGAELALVTDGLPLERLTRLTAAAARRGDSDPAARASVEQWTREADSAERDGIPASALVAEEASPAKPGRLQQRDFDLGRGIVTQAAAGAPAAATAILLTHGDRRADWLHAGQALQRLLLHAASSWVFASLYTQPLENAITRDLIREQLSLPGHPQIVLQLGRAVTSHATPRRSTEELID